MYCRRISLWPILIIALAGYASVVHARLEYSFSQAKKVAKIIYQDHRRTFYCNCPYDQHAKKVDIDRCGYCVQKNHKRARRLEWEHLMPVSVWGQTLPCWRKPLCCKKDRCYKGRRCCAKTDPRFAEMESDLHNLVPEIGELNGLRSNYHFAELPDIAFGQFGDCSFKLDPGTRRVEPCAAIKGMIARAYLYMANRYHVPLSDSQQQLFLAWHQHYPPDAWEIERERRIARFQGTHNRYVTDYEVEVLRH